MALVPFPSKSANVAPEDPDWDEEGPEESGGGKMSFLEHLDELRKRIIRSLLALVGGIAIAFIFIKQLRAFVMEPMFTALGNRELIYTEPTEGMMLWLKIGLIAGVLIASPAILTQVWLFIAPGLYANEKKLAVPFVLLGTVLAVGGAAFAHYQAFPITWTFLGGFDGPITSPVDGAALGTVKFAPRIGPAFTLYMTLILVFAGIFQMPTLVLFLARMGLVTARFLIKNIKYAVLIIFVAGALLSPGGDPMGQVLMAGPMVVLYIMSIGLAWAFGKKRKREPEPDDA